MKGTFLPFIPFSPSSTHTLLSSSFLSPLSHTVLEHQGGLFQHKEGGTGKVPYFSFSLERKRKGRTGAKISCQIEAWTICRWGSFYLFFQVSFLSDSDEAKSQLPFCASFEFPCDLRSPQTGRKYNSSPQVREEGEEEQISLSVGGEDTLPTQTQTYLTPCWEGAQRPTQLTTIEYF